MASSLNPAPSQPPVPNAVTTGLSNGEFKIFNRFGEVHVIVDVTGYYTPDAGGGGDGGVSQADFDALAAQVDALASQNEALSGENDAQQAAIEALSGENDALKSMLAGVERDGDTLMFEGMNVQIVNGEGSTDTTNALGNLIVGYNTDNFDDEVRTGSHTLVIGDEHSYTSYGGLIAGYNNTVNGNNATVSGGTRNTADGYVSSVSGGDSNTADGYVSSVSGGDSNTAAGAGSSVSGGDSNTAVGSRTAVAGGDHQECTWQNVGTCLEGSPQPVDVD